MLVVSVSAAIGLGVSATAADVCCSVENHCSVFRCHISSRQGGHGACDKDPTDTAIIVTMFYL
ncbi:hypothetical protein L798_01265 [Zootermopsis nevadensis]|uniref:Uncharacterized protein n=1 Tax=Zootermopsis nevadensis TaxID=136037 RepID=A0A067QJW4_ZOONE|nr:hypothetical protein L798_01265 [Zootermopsis nevadensis]